MFIDDTVRSLTWLEASEVGIEFLGLKRKVGPGISGHKVRYPWQGELI
jgi:hypothetical protein